MILRAQVEHLIDAGITSRDALQQLSSLLTQAAISFENQRKEKGKWSEVAPDLQRLQDLILEAAALFDECWLQRILDEAFFYYEPEIVSLQLLQPVLTRLGQLWEEKKISSIGEHFLTNVIRSRLLALYQSTPHVGKGPTIWLGCVPKEGHEIGPTMLALFWRRAGLNVCYLGASLEKKALIADLKRFKPAILCLSVMSRHRLHDLCDIGRECSHMEERPILCFGGNLFLREPGLIKHPDGIYLGYDLASSSAIIKELLRMRATLSAMEVEELYRHRGGRILKATRAV
jgi:methanogenic corrinoid protein MtbC1